MSDEVKDDLQPIVELFGGVDGGVGFVKLRHILPEIYANEDDSNSMALRNMVKAMSKLCKYCMV